MASGRRQAAIGCASCYKYVLAPSDPSANSDIRYSDSIKEPFLFPSCYVSDDTMSNRPKVMLTEDGFLSFAGASCPALVLTANYMVCSEKAEGLWRTIGRPVKPCTALAEFVPGPWLCKYGFDLLKSHGPLSCLPAQ
eukprot:1153127-Pelagomonas_calceolata.AAC.2